MERVHTTYFKVGNKTYDVQVAYCKFSIPTFEEYLEVVKDEFSDKPEVGKKVITFVTKELGENDYYEFIATDMDMYTKSSSTYHIK